jgi:multimeric flavodoxin WrbA
MIHILGICGSPVKGGNTEAVLNAALDHVRDGVEVGTEFISLAGRKFDGCMHCNWCLKNQTGEKFCVQEDDMVPIYPKIAAADGILMATPVHFGRLSGLMANMIDRLRVFVHGNMHSGCLRNKIGGSLAVAFFRGGGVETTLSSINSMFFSFQMIIATSRTYQLGAASFTSTDGKGRVQAGVRHMAMEDEFGTQSGRFLAERMVELARIVKTGEEVLGQ